MHLRGELHCDNYYFGVDSKDAWIQGTNVRADSTASRFDVIRSDFDGAVALGEIVLHVTGRHNVTNALGAIHLGVLLGIPFEKIAEGLANYSGIGRRFETLGERDDV